MSRLKRFQHLESPRAERPNDGPRKTEERFSRMESERAPGEIPPPPPPPPPSAQRIRTQVAEPSLALDPRDRVEQQFIRCMRCEADNSRYAQDCIHCGASLRTEEQRAYNEAFHQRRQVEVAQQAEAEAQFQQRRHEASDAERRERVAMQAQAYEQMKEEANRAVEDGDTPWGVRLLRSIKDPTWQWVAIGCFVLLGGLCVWGLWASWSAWWSVGPEWQPRYTRRRGYGSYPSLRTIVSLVGLLALLTGFTPPSWWRRHHYRRGWWDWW